MIVLNDSPTQRKKMSEKHHLVDENSNGYHKLKVFQRFGIQKIFGEIFVPLFLMISVPVSTMTLWYICRYKNGNITELLESKEPASQLIYNILFGQWDGSLFPIYVITGNSQLTFFSIITVLPCIRKPY